jgi:SNF2 family DNA or RNA helicase
VSIRIDYLKESATLEVRGENSVLIKDPTVSLFLRQLQATIVSNQLITLSVNEDGLYPKYQTLTSLIVRGGMSVSNDENLSEQIKAIQQEEEDFKEFSTSAKEIWDGTFDADEFESFSKVIQERLIERNPYRLQKLSAYHLAFSQHACNYSVPGAGKTTIVYAAFSYLNSLPQDHPKHVNHLLVAGPLSAFGAWEKEFSKIYGRRALSKRLSGEITPGEREEYLKGISLESNRTEITLTSYPTLANNRDDFEYFLNSGSRRVMLVLDEAHYIKSSDGVWSSNALSLAKYASSRVILTGTPVPNGYEDLRNLFQFIHPDRNIIGFSANVLRLMTKGKMSEAAISKLKENVRPFYTRIRKKDLGLPPIEINVEYFNMGSSQAEIYKYIESKTVPGFESDFEDLHSTLAKAKVIRLRQAAANPSLLLKPLIEEGFTDMDIDLLSISDARMLNLISQYNPVGDSERLSKIREIITRLRKRHNKILIWSYFLGNLDLLAANLSDLVEEIFEIRGATPVGGDDGERLEELGIVTREEIIDSFLTSKSSSILIANPQAVGESISLHEACHVAIYYDRDFNAGRFIQSKDRIHRYGLKEGQLTEYYYLIASTSVDEDIDLRLNIKEKRLTQLIDSDEIPLFQIALGENDFREDIKSILQSYENRKSNT